MDLDNRVRLIIGDLQVQLQVALMKVEELEAKLKTYEQEKPTTGEG